MSPALPKSAISSRRSDRQKYARHLCLPIIPSGANISTQLFQRDDLKDGKPHPHVLSIDFDDPGDLCMTSESDETIQIYNVKEGRHDKSLLSKKYGVKLAKFTHGTSSIIYASTNQNGATRMPLQIRVSFAFGC